MRFLDEKDYGKVFSRVRFKDGSAYIKICNMENFLNRKTNVFEHFHVTKCLRYYLVATHPEFRHKGVYSHSTLINNYYNNCFKV